MEHQNASPSIPAKQNNAQSSQKSPISKSSFSRLQKSAKSAFSKVRKTLVSPLNLPKSSNNANTVQNQKMYDNNCNFTSIYKNQKVPLFSPTDSLSSCDQTTPKLFRNFRRNDKTPKSKSPFPKSKSPFRPISFNDSFDTLSPRIANMNVSRTQERLDFSDDDDENEDTLKIGNVSDGDTDTLKTESEKNSQNSQFSGNSQENKILPEINADSEIVQNIDSGVSLSQSVAFRKPSSSVPLERMCPREDYVMPRFSSQQTYGDEIGPSGMVQSNSRRSYDDNTFIPIDPSLEIPPFQPNQMNNNFSMSTPKLESVLNVEPSSAFPEFCPKNKLNLLNTPIQLNKSRSKITPRTPAAQTDKYAL